MILLLLLLLLLACEKPLDCDGLGRRDLACPCVDMAYKVDYIEHCRPDQEGHVEVAIGVGVLFCDCKVGGGS